MNHNHTVFIPTSQFYTEPKCEAYHNEKRAHLQRIINNYYALSTEAKWSLLITNFTSSLQEQDCPNEQLDAFIEKLNAFKRERETTSNSQFNLSLSQCVNYFEEFYFLYTTTDERFKITAAAKQTLLKSIEGGMIFCETGKNGRFYNALQDHQKDTDWIQNELVKARCVVLLDLHAKYTAQYGFSESMDVHVYDSLVKLANKNQLGIPQKETIMDVHGWLLKREQIKSFFYENYSSAFDTYQKQAIDNLTHTYLYELAESLSIDMNTWNEHEISLSAKADGQVNDLTRSLESHFQLTANKINDLFDGKIGNMSEDYQTFSLCEKPKIAGIIRQLVTEKLITDGYYVNISDITDHLGLRLPKEIKKHELIAIHEALASQDNERIIQCTKKNPLLLIHFPELILTQLHSNPQILSFIPHWLKKDTRFVDAALTTLNEMLCHAIQEQHNDEIRNITTHILNLIDNEYDYLACLSTLVLANPLVAHCLLEKNGLLFGMFHGALRQHSELQAQAIRQNPAAADYREAPYTHPKTIQEKHFNVWSCLPRTFQQNTSLKLGSGIVPHYQAMQNYLKVQSCLALLTNHRFTRQDCMTKMNCLTPNLLIDVIAYRKEKHLPPLPFFETQNALDDLKQFNACVNEKLHSDWNQGYLYVKRLACESEQFNYVKTPYYEKNAITFLTKSNDWFTAFSHYHQYQTSMEKKWLQIINAGNKLMELMVSMVKIGLTIGITGYAYPILRTLKRMFIGALLLTWCSLWILNNLIRNSLLATLNDLLWELMFLDAQVLGIGIDLVFSEIWVCVKNLQDIFNGAVALFGLINDMFLNHQNPDIARSLEETCDNAILRLAHIDEESAQEKSNLLKRLLSYAKQDAETLESEQANAGSRLSEFLDKKYTIAHHDQQHDVSFNEVARIRRAHQGDFKLDRSEQTMMRFFSPKTTTEIWLETPLLAP